MNVSSQRQSMNPFPGLRPFYQDEDYLFFGREKQIAELLSLLRSNRFLAVVGTSGSGKSSLVRAGLIPALHRGTMSQAGSAWEVVVMRPEATPLDNLARAVVDSQLFDDDIDQLDRIRAMIHRSSFGLLDVYENSSIPKNTNLLLIVDQFEELFRFERGGHQSSDQANHFVNLLLQATQATDKNVYVILTMRSDYLGDCSVFSGLAEAVNRGEYLIPRLSRAELKTAIVGPVHVGGANISNRLVQKLLNNVSDNPDQLPVLQHALMRTWNVWLQGREPNKPIDTGHFEFAGGMERALSQHAGEIYDSLTDGQKKIAERMFRTLTEQGSDNRGIRRPTRFDELVKITNADEADLFHVIDAFRGRGRTFLMPTHGVPILPDTMIDISHESLMRVWDKLREWVDLESQSARIYRRLADTAALYKEGKSGLFRDPDLRIALTWREQNEINETWGKQYHSDFDAAMGFLDASKAAQDAEEREKEMARQRELAQAKALADLQQRRADEQQKATQKFRRLSYFMGVLAIVSVLSGIASYFSYRKALDAQETAENSRVQAMKAAVVSDWSRNDLRAVKQRLESIPPDDRQWEWGVMNASSTQYLGRLHESPFVEEGYHVGLSTGGRLLASRRRGGNEDPISLFNLETGKEVASLTTVSSNSGVFTFSAEDTYLAYQHWGTPGVQIYRLENSKPCIPWERERAYMAFLGFGNNSGSAYVFNSDDGTIEKLPLPGGKMEWSLAMARDLGPTSVPLGLVNQDSTKLVVSYSDGEKYYLSFVDLETRKWGLEIELADEPEVIRFSQDEKSLIVDDRYTLRQYDAETLELQRQKRMQAYSRESMSCFEDSERFKLATFGANGRLEIYDREFNQIASLSGASSNGGAVTVDHDEQRLISAHTDGSVYSWDMRSVTAIPIYASSLASLSDGRLLAGLSLRSDRPGQQVLEIDPLVGRSIRPYFQLPPDPRHGSTATDVQISNTRNRIAVTRETGWGHGRLRMFDRTLGTVLWDYEPRDVEGDYSCLAWNNDESLVAIGTASKFDGIFGDVDVIDAETGQRVARLPRQEGTVNAIAFSPSGDLLITARSNGVITAWDWRNQKQSQEQSLVYGAGDTPSTAAGISCLAIVSGSDQVVAALGNGNICVWNYRTGKVIRKREVHGQPIVCLTLHPSGRRVVSIDRGGAMKVLNREDLEEQFTLQIEGSPLRAQFDTSGNTLFVATSTAIRIYDAIPEVEKKEMRDRYAKDKLLSEEKFSQLRGAAKPDEIDFSKIQRAILKNTEWSDSEKQSVFTELRRATGRAMDACYRSSEKRMLGAPFTDFKASEISGDLKLAILKHGNNWTENPTEYYEAKSRYMSELSQHVVREWKESVVADASTVKQFISDWDSYKGIEFPSVNDIAWDYVEKGTSSFDDNVLAYFAIDQFLREIGGKDRDLLLSNYYNTLCLAEYRVGLYPLAIESAKTSNRGSKDSSLLRLNASVAAAAANRMQRIEERDRWIELLSKMDAEDESPSGVIEESEKKLLDELKADRESQGAEYKIADAWASIVKSLERSEVPTPTQVAWVQRASKRMKTAGMDEFAKELVQNTIKDARDAVLAQPKDLEATLSLAFALIDGSKISNDEAAKKEAEEIVRERLKEIDLDKDPTNYFTLLNAFMKLGMLKDGLAFIAEHPSQGQFTEKTIRDWFFEQYLETNSFESLARDWRNVQWGPLSNRCDYSLANKIVWKIVKNASSNEDSFESDLGVMVLDNADWYDFNSDGESRSSNQNSLAIALYRSGLFKQSLAVVGTSDQLTEDPDTRTYNRLVTLMNQYQLGDIDGATEKFSESKDKFLTLAQNDPEFRSLWLEFAQMNVTAKASSDVAYDENAAWKRLDQSIEKYAGGLSHLDWKSRSSLLLFQNGNIDLAKEFIEQVLEECQKIPLDGEVTLEQQSIVGYSYAVAFSILKDAKWKELSADLWKKQAVSNSEIADASSSGNQKMVPRRPLWYRANSLFLQEDWDETSQVLDEILKVQPAFLEAWVMRAKVDQKRNTSANTERTKRAIEQLVPNASHLELFREIYQ